MQKAIIPQKHVMTEQQRKGLIIITPILIGAVAYGTSVSIMILKNLYQILF